LKVDIDLVKNIIILILVSVGSYLLGRLIKKERYIQLEAQVSSQSVMINNTRNFLISSLNDNGSIRAFNQFGWQIPLKEIKQQQDPGDKK